MERPGFSRLSSADAYEMLNITRGGEPTLAAVLNFPIYPQALFPISASPLWLSPARFTAA